MIHSGQTIAVEWPGVTLGKKKPMGEVFVFIVGISHYQRSQNKMILTHKMETMTR